MGLFGLTNKLSGGLANNLTGGGGGAKPSVPTVLSAEVDASGSVLEFTFSEDVNNHAGFSVTSNSGVPISLTYDTGNAGDQIEFLTSRVILDGEVLTAAYTPGNVVSFPGGVPLEAFSGLAVTNDSEVVRPTIVSSTIDITGLVWTLVPSEAVTGHSTFSITPSGGAATATFDAFESSPTLLVFGLSRPILESETATYAYVVGDVVSQATGAPLAAFSGVSVTNDSGAVRPTVVSAAFSGVVLEIVFSESVSGVAGFSFALPAHCGDATYNNGEGSNTYQFALSGDPPYPWESLTYSYSPGDVVSDASGIALAAIGSTAVTNNSTTPPNAMINGSNPASYIIAHPLFCFTDAAHTIPCTNNTAARTVYDHATMTWIDTATLADRWVMKTASGGTGWILENDGTKNMVLVDVSPGASNDMAWGAGLNFDSVTDGVLAAVAPLDTKPSTATEVRGYNNAQIQYVDGLLNPIVTLGAAAGVKASFIVIASNAVVSTITTYKNGVQQDQEIGAAALGDPLIDQPNYGRVNGVGGGAGDSFKGKASVNLLYATNLDGFDADLTALIALF